MQALLATFQSWPLAVQLLLLVGLGLLLIAGRQWLSRTLGRLARWALFLGITLLFLLGYAALAWVIVQALGGISVLSLAIVIPIGLLFVAFYLITLDLL